MVLGAILPAGVIAVERSGTVDNAWLLPEEMAVLGRVSNARRQEFTAARTCAREALIQFGLPETPILPGPSREPLWPAPVVGSITHCAGYCAAAVADAKRWAAIGIDAEVHMPLPAGVINMVARDEERTWLGLMSRSHVCWDCVLFSVKESVYKAWFPLSGQWLDFGNVSVSIDVPAGTFHARILVERATAAARAPAVFDGRYIVKDGRVHTTVAIPTVQH